MSAPHIARELDAPARASLLARIAATHGTPTFVYFMDDVKRRIDALRAAFDGMFQISYAMKCNPHPRVLATVRGWVDALDVSSRGELARAVAAGFRPDCISFTGPAKQAACLTEAVAHGIGEVVIESVREARLLSQIAAASGRVQPVLVRIAPRQVPRGFGVNMAGRPCQFGIDEEQLDAALSEILALPGLTVAGFHAFSGTQSLKAEAVAENYGIFAGLFQRASEAHGLGPRKLIFGSGLGIRYHEGDEDIDLFEVAASTLPVLRALKAQPRFCDTTLMLETGRYLLGEAGVYLTRVVNRKHSRGAEIATLDGGMHHHLGACGHLGMVIHRPYRMFKLGASSDAERHPFDLYGPLCTTIDVLGRGVRLPWLSTDDVIAVAASGAYAATASPQGFISHAPANEIFVYEDTAPDPTIVVGDAAGSY